MKAHFENLLQYYCDCLHEIENLYQSFIYHYIYFWNGLLVLEGYVIPSNLNSAQDLQRALSLLSTDTKGPYEARLFAPDNPNRLVNPNYANQPSISQSPMNLGIQTLPFASVDSQSWGNGHHHPIELQMQIHHPNIEGGNNLFQDFQLFKTPCEIGMFSNQIS